MSNQAKEQHNNILLAIAGFSAVVIIVALIGFLALGRDPEVIQGEMEVEEYRVSGKVPGRILELHPAFPQRCNIEFARIEADGSIRTRVWERGSGITMACGTGACATAVAACITERAGRKSRIVMDGGTLDIEWRESDNHVYMTGPAAFVFDGEIELP